MNNLLKLIVCFVVISTNFCGAMDYGLELLKACELREWDKVRSHFRPCWSGN